MAEDTYTERREMREQKQDHRRFWREKNISVLRASGLIYVERTEAFLFREAGKPRVDFYPSRGSWRVVGRGRACRLMHGEADAFLAWYAKQGIA